MSAPAAAAPAPAAAAPAVKPNGAATATPGQSPASPPPAGGEAVTSQQQPYRFKKELKVNGKAVPVDLDEAGLERELQVGRHLKQQYEALQAQLKQKAELEELLAANPREALKRKGHDIDAILLAEAQRQAQLAELSPEQQRIAQLEAELAQRNEATERQKAEAQQRAKQHREQQSRQQTKAELFESLKHCGFPIEGEGNKAFRGTALAMGARIQARAIRAGQPPLSPQQLGAAIQQQFLADMTRTAAVVTQAPDFRTKHGQHLSGFIEASTTGLEGEALLSLLGPKLLTRVTQAQLAALNARKGVTVGGEAPAPAAAQPTGNGGAGAPLDFISLRDALRRGR